MRRGEEEGILKIAVDVDAEHCIESLRRLFVRPGSATREWMEAAVADSFKRLIRPLDRDRTARGGQGEGRRRGDPGFRREPAPTAALLAAGAEARRGHRPGIPHGMQGRGARRAGQPAAQHDRLPPSAAGPGGRSGRDAEIAGRQVQGRGVRHRGRHGGPRDRTAGPRTGAGRRGRYSW